MARRIVGRVKGLDGPPNVVVGIPEPYSIFFTTKCIIRAIWESKVGENAGINRFEYHPVILPRATDTPPIKAATIGHDSGDSP